MVRLESKILRGLHKPSSSSYQIAERPCVSVKCELCLNPLIMSVNAFS